MGLSYAIMISLILAVFGALYNAQWFNAFLASLAFVIICIPGFLKRNYKIFLPLEFEVTLGIFVYFAIYLGEVKSYYVSFWWWDIFLHTASGFLLGLVGFLIVYILNSEKRIPLHLSPLFVALFAFAFSVAIGVLWEIFEFSVDLVLGFNMQKSGLIDTMSDLIVNAVGALVIAIIGGLYVKNVRASFLDRLITKFAQKNPKFFLQD